ncbi:hypothetical protein TrLO_g13553 [Triparma laevis f. longispina]|uniref:Uncharacterized protein n=1 Tax=Triparma laevis f. longispina TaxID=1714387 RepID=A0A9W7F3H5_9STRA|nr:hypothetical protein TrLO_g13553 [Triparma laevis f. longispina]
MADFLRRSASRLSGSSFSEVKKLEEGGEKETERKVSWGIPAPHELEESVDGPDKLGAGYVSKNTSILDGCQPGSPVVLWEGSLFKKRRIMGGYIPKHFSICANNVGKDSMGNDMINISFCYRDAERDPMPTKMNGHISEVEVWEPQLTLPKPGGGLLIHCITESGAYKKYELCAESEHSRSEFINAFEDAERLIKADISIMAEENISERAARAAVVKQGKMVDLALKEFNDLIGLHDSMKQETGVLQSDLKEMLDNDYKIIVDCRDMFDSIKAHIFLADKGGASLSTVRLEQLVNVVGETLEHCKEIQMDKEVLRAHLCSNQHREKLNHTIANSIVAIEDMQFGMADMEAFRKERKLAKEISHLLLQAPGVSDDMKARMTPPEGSRKVLKKEFKYSSSSNLSSSFRDESRSSGSGSRQSLGGDEEEEEQQMSGQSRRNQFNRRHQRRQTGRMVKKAYKEDSDSDSD